ncbi:hypothetical protein OG413_41405 [Streptomyces sp. NBC_01433]|uniref:hypothetical protein n=1 Tax=Streptomyces sp. NBC_01433 TaxID=2903864 RepID=UPI0022530C7D|nr:hypothetical protein [Streptomyces sp. NBC_01433]MCX4681661.1 hypothetical protein [Streptomyces sp. NBC_01433]
MLKYTLRVHKFTAQAANLTSEPPAVGDCQDSAVDDAQNPTQVIVYTTTGPAAALRIANRHLTLVHARLAYTNPGAVGRTADDIVYAEARTRAETLTPGQREDESMHTIHSEYDALRMSALFDVMDKHGEIDI